MTVEICDEFYTKRLLDDNPDKIFVYGDNLARKGCGGQAVIRYSKNAFGFSTKRFPSRSIEAYYTDTEPFKVYEQVERLTQDVKELKKLSEDYVVVFPAGGLGTGLSFLQHKSPRFFSEMNDILLLNFGIINSAKGCTKSE